MSGAASRMAPLAGAVMLALVLACGPLSSRASMTFEEYPAALPCTCSDVYPRDSFLDAKVEYTCWEQSSFDGACKQPFMTQTPEEVPEGYCQISCGRCSCCPKLADVLRGRGLSLTLWALSLNPDVGQHLAMPGYMATVLAPTDAAWLAALNKMGYASKEAVEADGYGKSQVAQIAKYHVLPPVYSNKAVWTKPFMRRGVAMPSLLGRDHAVAANMDESNGAVTLVAPRSQARITEGDVYACKGYIQVLDGVLIPWGMKGYGK